MEIEVRHPTAEDAASIWTLVLNTASLDCNSVYAYLLLCTHFAQTSLVAEGEGKLVGFVLGYVRPDDAATAFVWQVAVDESARGQGLGARLLDSWFARCARRSNVRFLEATVTPDNGPSKSLFTSFALRHGTAIREDCAFADSLFPNEAAHDEERLLRVGPIPLFEAIAFASKSTGST